MVTKSSSLVSSNRWCYQTLNNIKVTENQDWFLRSRNRDGKDASINEVYKEECLEYLTKM